MHRDGNVIGPNVAKYRYQRNWTQDDLVGKLQLVGCYMTRDMLASIETQRCSATDKQIEFFAHVLGVEERHLFPITRHFTGQRVRVNMEITTRRRPPKRPPRSRTPLAQP